MGRRRGKRWQSCMMWFATSVGALFYTISCIKAAEDVGEGSHSGNYYNFPKNEPETKSGTSCVAKQPSIHNKFLMVVSTLDGKVSALDIQDSGKILWSVNADTRPLLSSSISNLEITRNGLKTRLIPSLDGGLYQYDGDSIEAVPLTAETLLSSSFKMTEDITMIGGKDILSYGIDPVSGQLKYTCSASGCNTFGDTMVTDEDDVLVITRNTQTVRAVDSRAGIEKWNFSVGAHELEFLPGTNIKPVIPIEEEDGVNIITCPVNGDAVEKEDEDLLKIVVPEGLVVSLNAEDLENIKWQHKFSSPVANAWILRDGILKPVSVFDNKHVPAMSSFQPPQDPPVPQPLLYIGKHQNQMYVQPSVAMKEKMNKVFQSNNRKTPVPRVAWKPYLASAPSRTPTINNKDLPRITNGEENSETGLVIYNYPFDNGYYLYPEFSFTVPDEQPENKTTEDDVIENITQTVWTYWKEVLTLSAFLAILVHLILTKMAVKQGLIIIKNCNSLEDVNGNNKLALVEKKPEEYISRYTSDFEHLQVLGKGGFGIVFEARNKVDDCNYAVKRISLHSEGSREKVMREVKALAKLEHSGIVRFFNAWLETPPPGWQEDKDKQFEDSECLTGFTPCNSVTQRGTGSLSIRMPPSPDFDLQNPFGGIKNINQCEGFAKSKKAGGSQEFSVHTDSISFSREGSVRQESYLEGVDETWNDNSLDVHFKLEDSEDSGSYSKNIPFTNITDKNYNQNNSFSIVFEDSGCAEKSSKSDSGEIIFSNDFTEGEHINNDIHIDISKTGSSMPIVSNSKKDNTTKNKSTASSYKNKVSTPKLYLYIQMQLCRRETLKDWLISNNHERDRNVVLDIFDQIVGAVEYVHSQGLMHRDLKPSNIFFSLDGVIKIGDFGLVTALEDQELELYCGGEAPYKRHTAQVGTQMYMSPEQISGKAYGHKVDVFSLGMILFELFYCFSTQMERVRTLLDVKRQKFPQDFERDYKKETVYMSWLLSPDPGDRPSSSQIVDSPLLEAFSSRHSNSRVRLRTTSSSSSGSFQELG